MFELRTYESASDQDHKRKVEMFNSGEFDVFRNAGFWQIFYGDTLVGSRLPNLTYMIGFPDLAERDQDVEGLRGRPGLEEAERLVPVLNFEEIVSNSLRT